MDRPVACIPYQLGEEAIQYLKDYLRGSKTLARLVVESQDLDRGQVLTYLPPGIPPTTVNNFKTGGVMPFIPQAWTTPVPGERLVVHYQLNTGDYLVDMIEQFLAGGETRVCIMEHYLGSPSDPWLSDARAPYWAFENELYFHVASGDASVEIIKTTIGEVHCFHVVGFMISLPPGHTLTAQTGGQLTLDEMKLLAARVEKLFATAYDAESYLIWSAV